MNTADNHSSWKASTSPPAIQSQTLSRVIAVVRGFTGVAGLISLGVLAGEAILPDDYKPSTIIGGFHGRLEAADAAAKMGTVPEYTRRNAEASAQPPAIAAMEADAFKQQQQLLAGALQAQSAIANTADVACMGSKFISPNDQDWGWLGSILGQGCGVGDQVRGSMMSTLRHGGQDNSVLIQRPRAGDE